MRRPALARCGLLPHRVSALDVFRQWMIDNSVSDRDLVAVTGLSLRRVVDVLNGDAPLPVEWIFALPERRRIDLNARFTAALLSRRTA